ncbi:hypothetical protein Tco_1548105 [Tanacetum coccineum]
MPATCREMTVAGKVDNNSTRNHQPNRTETYAQQEIHRGKSISKVDDKTYLKPSANNYTRQIYSEKLFVYAVAATTFNGCIGAIKSHRCFDVAEESLFLAVIFSGFHGLNQAWTLLSRIMEWFISFV